MSQRRQQRAAAHDPTTRRITTATTPPPAVAHSPSVSCIPAIVTATVEQRAERTIHIEMIADRITTGNNNNSTHNSGSLRYTHENILDRTVLSQRYTADDTPLRSHWVLVPGVLTLPGCWGGQSGGGPEVRHSWHHFGQSSLASKFLAHLNFVLEILVIRQKALKHSASFRFFSKFL